MVCADTLSRWLFTPFSWQALSQLEPAASAAAGRGGQGPVQLLNGPRGESLGDERMPEVLPFCDTPVSPEQYSHLRAAGWHLANALR